jgi:radical SAM protein with 4Fe4S-binding SPASM domain
MPTTIADNASLNAREMASGAAVLRSWPTRAWFSITGKCNLLCTHCPRSLLEEKHLSSAEMPRSVFERVQAQIFPWLEVCRIGGNNFGEQLFSRHWNEYSAGMRQFAFTPWVISNAQVMNSARIRELVEAGYVIDISIDAASPHKYREIRGASLDKLIEHVREIVRVRAEIDATGDARRRCRVIFSFTAFAENVDELPGLVRLAADLDVDAITVTHYMPTLEEQRYQSLFYHQSTANRIFDEARRLAAELNVEIELPPPYRVESLSQAACLKPAARKRLGRPVQEPAHADGDTRPPPCAHPWTSVSIDENGQVFPCCQSNLLLGDLRKSSFAEIWNGKRYQRLRKTVNSAQPLADCRRCVLRGETFTSVDCAEPAFFLRAIDGVVPQADRFRRVRELVGRSRGGRWIWRQLRHAYKNFFEWHLATR